MTRIAVLTGSTATTAAGLLIAGRWGALVAAGAIAVVLAVVGVARRRARARRWAAFERPFRVYAEGEALRARQRRRGREAAPQHRAGRTVDDRTKPPLRP